MATRAASCIHIDGYLLVEYRSIETSSSKALTKEDKIVY